MENISHFGNRLKEERKKLGLTQAQAAEKCGVVREMWGKYESGQFWPNCEVIFSFISLGADVSFLFAGKKPSENSDGLREDEKELLDYYRSATVKSRDIILTIARTQEKKETNAAFNQVG